VGLVLHLEAHRRVYGLLLSMVSSAREACQAAQCEATLAHRDMAATQNTESRHHRTVGTAANAHANVAQAWKRRRAVADTRGKVTRPASGLVFDRSGSSVQPPPGRGTPTPTRPRSTPGQPP
jgi:hypothetical protein